MAPQGQGEACFFSPAFCERSSASKAVPVITPVAAVGFRWPCIRCRRVWSCVRDSPTARLACEASRRFVLGHPAEQQHQCRRSLACLREDGPRQQGLVALTGPTAVCRKMPLGTEYAPVGVPTVWAHKPMRGEVTFQPSRAEAVIQELGDREVNPGAMISNRAR